MNRGWMVKMIMNIELNVIALFETKHRRWDLLINGKSRCVHAGEINFLFMYVEIN